MRDTFDEVISDAGMLALFGRHDEDIARHEGHLPAPALRAFQFRRFMLGDGFRALELLPAFLATILIGWHVLLLGAKSVKTN
jgi:hypothetical protein